MSEHQWKILISAYADNELSKEDMLRAERVLTDEPEAREYLNEIRQMSSVLKVVKDAPTSPDMEQRVLKSVAKGGSMANKTYWKAGVLTMCTLVIVGTAALHTYVQRGIQGRLRSTTDDIASQYTSASPAQYVKKESVAVSGSSETPATPAQYYRKGSVAKSGSLDRSASSVLYAANESVAVQASTLRSPSSGAHQAYRRIAINTDPQYWNGTGSSNDASSEAVYSKGGFPKDKSIETGLIMQDAPYYSGSMGGSMKLADKSYEQPLFQRGPDNTAEYKTIDESGFLGVVQNPLSTFSADVDTASYTNIRRFLNSNQRPSKDAVRIEEMINYFGYDYPKPEANDPFSITTKAAVCPWNTDHRLVMVGLKGKTLQADQLPPSNLTFLLDVSGSMQSPDKLPLIRQAFTMMVGQLRAQDKVAIVVYASKEGVLLDSTSGADSESIINAINNLQAGGSTAGGAGIKKAYEIAQMNFIKGGNNRVILATDGDFNVGVSSTSEMVRLIEEKRDQGIFLTVIGVGNDNLKDGRLMEIADKGNGTYHYFDSIQEARKVFLTELGSTLFTIAKDVKIQVEFNPAVVKAYRLVGYEKRKLNQEDFNNDKKDAGEMGAGHTVTALYEIVLTGTEEVTPSVDSLKYQEVKPVAASRDEMLTVKLRYKEPNEDVSKLLTRTLNKTEIQEQLQGDFAFAAAVAEFGLLLKNSEFKGNASLEQVLGMAKGAKGEDKFGYREEFIQLVGKAQNLGILSSGGKLQFK